ncbi:cytochrome c maturation protein CcmE [Haloechinothrix sp. LS1_15]|uniref:cytochrome c maturation protein CcmE n=1 Tax=Haloechinothrix sp. LS1_15 TaxID=2652248 RepID=UPI002948684E|nr:cytochrome c maturation protein CcmE [Haloechinothrix sp. LS1_15]MDV6011855.1 cytochrome c maturation protein CcmE [Haloechinothrix sp. LS1_15]
MKRYRLLGFSGVGVVAVLVGALVFGNLNENLVYYLTPEEAVDKRAEFGEDRRFQLGGLVADGSVTRTDDGVDFVVTYWDDPDGPEVTVRHTGSPQQLFQPGVGVVVEGSWRGDEFVSDTMKVRHDEEYEAADMPESPAS